MTNKLSLAVLLFSVVLASSALAEGHGGHGKGHGKHHGKPGHGQSMRHANPMPNLMKVVKKQGDKLGLSDEQKAELTQWHDQNADNMHANFAKVGEMEKELNAATLAGKPTAELMTMASDIMKLRTQIIATKAACRDNMRRVLSDEQYAQVVALYGEMQQQKMARKGKHH